METTAPEQAASANALFPRPWRVFRLNFRYFLVGVALLGILLGNRLNTARRQRAAVSEIQRFGGHVRYDFATSGYDPDAKSWVPAPLLRALGPDLFHDVVGLSAIQSPVHGLQSPPSNGHPEDFRRWLSSLPRLKSLMLGGQCTDDMLEAVGHSPDLEVLTINGSPTGVTDAGIAHLDGLKNLRILITSHQNTTNAALEVFGGLPRLEILQFQRGQVTHAGIAQLRRLQNLRIAVVRGPELIILAGPKADPNSTTFQSAPALDLSDTPGLIAAFPPASSPELATGTRASPR